MARIEPLDGSLDGGSRAARRMTNSFTAWAVAVGAAGCGRCATAA